MAKIYVSSTFKDLQAERAAVRLVVERMRLPGVAMEAYVAESGRPLDKCLRDVRDCDVYVGIFAWRYGYIPPGQSMSITELEYRQAVDAGKPTLIFLLDPDAPWPRSRMDQDLSQIEALRQELSAALLCSTFHTADQLAGLVGAALHNHLTELQQRAPTVLPPVSQALGRHRLLSTRRRRCQPRATGRSPSAATTPAPSRPATVRATCRWRRMPRIKARFISQPVTSTSTSTWTSGPPTAAITSNSTTTPSMTRSSASR
ncbi:DUF4062 domain-containing protein [Nonomuraea maheshkhaliensis]|uniref:DUF4062 domain-containing protein n=1 Tax=Nonomuraea maheshkhaliensis TaxID=419590 RepID=UPI0031F72B4E